MAGKSLYFFEEGDPTDKRLLGGKGAGLCMMTQLGLPVPPGFVITTEVCRKYYELGGRLPDGLMDEVREAMRRLEQKTGKRFGDPLNPLLVSVRSGSMLSMPGMMDTILNLGLNDEVAEGLARLTGNRRFAFDAYRRFLQMFGRIVLGVSGEKFDRAFEEWKEKFGAKRDTDLTAEHLEVIVQDFKRIIKEETGRDFPSDPWKQLELAIEAVFRSWNNRRAIEYRNYYRIPHDLGTAVNIVTMVFGNMGEDSGTGVMFTRNPSTGEKELYGEFLFNAQGEDVVAGIRTPLHISELKERWPDLYRQLVEVADKLERHYRDMQDIEFTVERGRLYLLQTRTGKRTAQAAVKIAVDMVEEGIITKEEAILRIEPSQVEQLLHKQIDPSAKLKVIARGLNASPGAAVGKVVFDSEQAKEMGSRGEKVILVRPETSPDDVGGIIASQGVLTSRGGMTSHAAVVTRGLGKPAVVGCEEIRIDLERRLFEAPGGIIVREGDMITINGSTGEVILGEAPLIEPKLSQELMKLLSWCDEVKKLENWANADYPRDANLAREMGAQGIGLCRTEHMFFEEERLPIFRQVILEDNAQRRRELLAKLKEFQKSDFKGILKVMDGLPVVIRLLDPPLHEFLPRYEKLLEEVLTAKLTGRSEGLEEKIRLLKRVEEMRDQNPMLGLRGCRLGITHPEINEMQVRAIFEAACELKLEGYNPKPEIMIPLVAHANELKVVREQLEKVAKEVMQEYGVEVHYKFGTMIEVPRAALTADEIAEWAEFFSFGTNDLTQMTFAFSRDDVEHKFLFLYVDKKILPSDPFQTLDINGVGKLIKMAVELGRKKRPDLVAGICGEHGGDPDSIRFCHEVGLNYVSCSPYRIPVARLAAAQAALRAGPERERYL